MHGIHCIAPRPTTLILQQGEQKPRIDGILVGQPPNGLRPCRPAGGTKVLAVGAELAARCLNVRSNIEIDSGSGEDQLAVRDQLTLRRCGLRDPVRHNEKGSGGDKTRPVQLALRVDLRWVDAKSSCEGRDRVSTLGIVENRRDIKGRGKAGLLKHQCCGRRKGRSRSRGGLDADCRGSGRRLRRRRGTQRRQG